eukprot:1541607-Amphidinium_carterae.2
MPDLGAQLSYSCFPEARPARSACRICAMGRWLMFPVLRVLPHSTSQSRMTHKHNMHPLQDVPAFAGPFSAA